MCSNSCREWGAHACEVWLAATWAGGAAAALSCIVQAGAGIAGSGTHQRDAPLSSPQCRLHAGGAGRSITNKWRGREWRRYQRRLCSGCLFQLQLVPAIALRLLLTHGACKRVLGKLYKCRGWGGLLQCGRRHRGGSHHGRHHLLHSPRCVDMYGESWCCRELSRGVRPRGSEEW